VRTARDGDAADDASPEEVRKAAKKRRRRLGIASFAAGPFAAVAGEASDLYSETATVCDVVDLHRLDLSDAQIGGHMLVLWGVTDDPAAACGALDGTGRPIAELLAERVNAHYQAAVQPRLRHDRQQRSDVQARRRWIEPDVGRHVALRQRLARALGGVIQHAAPLELFKQIHPNPQAPSPKPQLYILIPWQ
jgi:hypothetical protein